MSTPPPYSFDYADVDENGEIVATHVELHPGTVRTRLEEGRITRKLLLAYGHVEGNPAPNDLFDNMTEYAGAMARTKTQAPWYAHSNMTAEDVRAAFELFMDKGDDFWDEFRKAARATATQKKTLTKTPTT